MKNNIYYERPNNLPKKTKESKSNQVRKENKEPYMSVKEQEEQYFQPSYEAPEYEEKKDVVVRYSNVKEWIANGALVVLSILLVISLGVLISEISLRSSTYTRKAYDFWSAIDYGNYAELPAMKWDNEVKGVHKTEELKQCYAVADYYEAATLYKAALECENEEAMQENLEKMEEAYKLFGDISYVAEEINEQLGIVKGF